MTKVPTDRKIKTLLDKRAGGLLLHITSLPSNFGIGDLGMEARAFARFLNKAGQHYWQLLPLNPVAQDQGFSPYSSVSAFAGNTLLISPELLAREGFLSKALLKSVYQKENSRVNFKKVEILKSTLNDLAYATFSNGNFADHKRNFNAFCKREQSWLDDFALYIALREKFGSDWPFWSKPYRLRDKKTLSSATAELSGDIAKIKWLQYIFFEQWNELKAFCHRLDVLLYGDVPFYVSYHSADVWSQQSIFNLDKNGKALTVAGVPPDYFNKNGQRWGMPTYDVSSLRRSKYKWWLNRIGKNLELFDVIRLDHFRAFAAFWEVPSKQKTAVKGIWKKGPGSPLFKTLENAFGTIPFVAEDLGYITPDVLSLREEFLFPGMKVLQFAFGGDMAKSFEAPHNYSSTNYFAYTGTHDNNTTKGWFDAELDKKAKSNLENYVGKKVNGSNVSSVLIELAYSTVARVVVVPVQDLLNLGNSARMNLPSSTENNWSWKLSAAQLESRHADYLLGLGKKYNR